MFVGGYTVFMSIRLSFHPSVCILLSAGEAVCNKPCLLIFFFFISTGSGIGRLMSLRFAQLGCRLVLWDVNKSGNEETASQCRKFGATTKCYEINLCNREDIYKVADQVF